MVTDNHYRWDFIQLSTDIKPTPATSPKVVDGSTLYTSDNSKLYVWYKDRWYEKTATGGGGGGGSYTAGDGIDITNDTISVDTTTIQPKLTAGSNITISDDTISATDTTYSNFTGTDGTSAGASGLVPAPATTDAGKFLKADGTWDTAGGGGSTTTIKTLTSADINWPSNNPTGIALWKLEPGIYRLGENGLSIWFCSGSSLSQANQQVDSNWSLYLGLFVVRPYIFNGNPSSMNKDIMAFCSEVNSNYAYLQWKIDNTVQDGYYAGTTLRAALEKEFIPLTGTSAPTSSTSAAYIGEIYVDTANDDAYICLDKTSGNVVWKKITP